jgi:hypothetical protein
MRPWKSLLVVKSEVLGDKQPFHDRPVQHRNFLIPLDLLFVSEQSRNLFVYRAVGERSFLYYVGYIAAMPLFLASLHGLSFQYLWPDATWWNDRAIIVFLNLTIFFGVAFSIRFLKVRRDVHPVLNRLMATPMVVAGGRGGTLDQTGTCGALLCGCLVFHAVWRDCDGAEQILSAATKPADRKRDPDRFGHRRHSALGRPGGSPEPGKSPCH